MRMRLRVAASVVSVVCEQYFWWALKAAGSDTVFWHVPQSVPEPSVAFEIRRLEYPQFVKGQPSTHMSQHLSFAEYRDIASN